MDNAAIGSLMMKKLFKLQLQQSQAMQTISTFLSSLNVNALD
jgi:hypothetical protein